MKETRENVKKQLLFAVQANAGYSRAATKDATMSMKFAQAALNAANAYAVLVASEK